MSYKPACTQTTIIFVNHPSAHLPSHPFTLRQIVHFVCTEWYSEYSAIYRLPIYLYFYLLLFVLLFWSGYHGTGGYLTVSSPPDVTPIAVAFPEAGKHLGYPNVDLNGPIQTGFSIPQGTIRRGARCSTSKAYLQSVKGRPNLHVVTFAYATKVLFNERKRAVAVQFDRFSLSHVVYARKEIICKHTHNNSRYTFLNCIVCSLQLLLASRKLVCRLTLCLMLVFFSTFLVLMRINSIRWLD